MPCTACHKDTQGNFMQLFVVCYNLSPCSRLECTYFRCQACVVWGLKRQYIQTTLYIQTSPKKTLLFICLHIKWWIFWTNFNISVKECAMAQQFGNSILDTWLTSYIHQKITLSKKMKLDLRKGLTFVLYCIHTIIIKAQLYIIIDQ